MVNPTGPAPMMRTSLRDLMAGPPLHFLDIGMVRRRRAAWTALGSRLKTGIKLTRPNEPDNDCFSL
jgi:hypothetical protein